MIRRLLSLGLIAAFVYAAPGCSKKKEPELVPPVISSAMHDPFTEEKGTQPGLALDDAVPNPYTALEERVHLAVDAIAGAPVIDSKTYEAGPYTVRVQMRKHDGVPIAITRLELHRHPLAADTSYVDPRIAEMVPHTDGNGVTCVYGPEEGSATQEEFYLILRQEEGGWRVEDKGFVLPGGD
jgi:hypothetical protein